MDPEVYTIVLPLYKAPSQRLQEFVSTFASDPGFLMQVVSDRETVLFVPNNGAKMLKVSTKLFQRESSQSADLKAISLFCSKFNMLSSFVPNASTQHKTTFQFELDENYGLFDDAVNVLIASFQVTDPAVILTIDNLFKLLD